MVYVDADFFIGLYSKGDIHHPTCLKLTESINEDFITSMDVIDEVATKLSYFSDKKISLQFLKDITSEKITVVYPDYSLFTCALEIFKKQTSKKISWTDCMNMAIATAKEIDTFLSFDKVYEKNGFRLMK